MTARVALAALTLFTCVLSLYPQDDDARRLWNEAFKRHRIPSPKAKQTTPPSAGAIAGTPLREESFVGVTLWRARPAVPSDEVRFRGLTHRKNAVEWTPVRRPVDDPIRPDEDIRLSIESARKGYLYVIDRDLYADGTQSAPNLIFPTTRLRGGNNEIEPGIPVEIPDAKDDPPTYSVESTRADQVGLRVIVLVAPRPLPGVAAGPDSQQLSDTQVQAWERIGAMRYVAGTVAGAYTRAERDAASRQAGPLTTTDPLPAMLFKSFGKPGEPIIVVVNLKIATGKMSGSAPL